MKIKQEWFRHDISILNLFGNPVPGSPKDLFRDIQQMDARYMVDTNIPWENYSSLTKYTNSAFILGPTIAKEKKLRTIFENSKGKKVRNNVFTFGLLPLSEGALVRRIIVERLDASALSTRDKKEMYACDDPNYRIEEYNSPLAREQMKFAILGRLGLSSYADLAISRRLHESGDKLLKGMKGETTKCFKDYRKCCEVAEIAYAVLLTRSQSARNEFLENDPVDRNVFEDMQLIHNALFWSACVLSDNYKHVGEMAKDYCGLDYHRLLT